MLSEQNNFKTQSNKFFNGNCFQTPKESADAKETLFAFFVLCLETLIHQSQSERNKYRTLRQMVQMTVKVNLKPIARGEKDWIIE